VPNDGVAFRLQIIQKQVAKPADNKELGFQFTGSVKRPGWRVKDRAMKEFGPTGPQHMKERNGSSFSLEADLKNMYTRYPED